MDNLDHKFCIGCFCGTGNGPNRVWVKGIRGKGLQPHWYLDLCDAPHLAATLHRIASANHGVPFRVAKFGLCHKRIDCGLMWVVCQIGPPGANGYTTRVTNYPKNVYSSCREPSEPFVDLVEVDAYGDRINPQQLADLA